MPSPSSHRRAVACVRSLVAISAIAATVVALAPPAAAAVPGRVIRHAGAITGRYIVVLREAPSVRATSAALARGYGGRVSRVFGSAIDGYAAEMTQAEALELSRDPRVAFVEEDARVRVEATQSPVAWNLDRLDERALPLDGSFTYAATGAGVTAYVIDTGIRLSHQEFEGRALSGYDAIDGGSADDCAGHGTHVAGTIGGARYGVAKDVTLVSVRVLDCEGAGSTSGVIAGIDWVTADHASGQPAVANMSLGGEPSAALDQAVERSVADGVVYAVAAGNGDPSGIAEDACSVSPARVPEAITVSATDQSDRKPTWANEGSCLDIFAPGVGIESAWASSDTASRSASGTSMASPHVAGVAAAYLQADPTATPAQVTSAIVHAATTGVVTSAGAGSPNALVYSAEAGSPSPSGAIGLSVARRSGRHGNVARLTWTGATTAWVNVYRNRRLLSTTPNDGAQRDRLGARTGTFVYRVCEQGTSVCSNRARVTF